MINTVGVINEMIKGYFVSTSGIIDFSGVKVYNNGTLLVTPNISIIESDSSGMYVFSYIPTVTGRSVILFGGEILAHIEVVSKNLYSSLKNIEDEALGSWSWNKTLGELTLLRQDGSPLANFDVTDNATTATRERTS